MPAGSRTLGEGGETEQRGEIKGLDFVRTEPDPELVPRQRTNSADLKPRLFLAGISYAVFNIHML